MQSRSLAVVWLGLCSACGELAAAERVEPCERCALAQRAYLKASNTGAGDRFGYSVALSADGSTLAVGAPDEASAASGIDGAQADDSAPNAGAVYVFVRSGNTWAQQAYVKASNTGAGDRFGTSVALSADGSLLAVGAPDEPSAATGIDGREDDDSAPGAGAVYVLMRRGNTWAQQAYVKASNTDPEDHFGHAIALAADGSLLAVGAWHESSGASGIGGDQTDNSVPGAGAIYVFARGGAAWRQEAYVKAAHPRYRDEFGRAVALSGEGSTLAVGLGPNQEPYDTGAVAVFARRGGSWDQQVYIQASNPEEGDRFGASLALSADGSTLAVGAHGAGAAYVLARTGERWTQQAYLEASNPAVASFFGFRVALSADGSALAVGAVGEASAATGINGDQADRSASGAGAVYLFARSDAAWRQEAYVKASNTGAGDQFGASVALSADGSELAVGARHEDSAATGVNGNQADHSAPDAGAVYVFDERG